MDLAALAQAGNGGKQPKRKIKDIIIEEYDPDRLIVKEPDDGEWPYFGPPIDKKALYSSIILPEDVTEKPQK